MDKCSTLEGESFRPLASDGLDVDEELNHGNTLGFVGIHIAGSLPTQEMAKRQALALPARQAHLSLACSSDPMIGCRSSRGEYLLLGTVRPKASAIART